MTLPVCTLHLMVDHQPKGVTMDKRKPKKEEIKAKPAQPAKQIKTSKKEEHKKR